MNLQKEHYTTRFENFQQLLGRIGLTESGFSQEDLVSNLIGFYIGIGEIERKTALKLCHPVSAKAAYAVWDRDGSVGSNKNSTWKPLIAKCCKTSTISEEDFVDECASQAKMFPKEFQRIKPAKKNEWFAGIRN